MKTYKLYIYISTILTSILFISSAYAAEVDGKSLLNSIKSNDHENVKSIDEFFNGYISGVADATVNVNWCPPHAIKRNQLQKIIGKYYRIHSERPSNETASAKDLVLEALTDAYPCKN